MVCGCGSSAPPPVVTPYCCHLARMLSRSTVAAQCDPAIARWPRGPGRAPRPRPRGAAVPRGRVAAPRPRAPRVARGGVRGVGHCAVPLQQPGNHVDGNVRWMSADTRVLRVHTNHARLDTRVHVCTLTTPHDVCRLTNCPMSQCSNETEIIVPVSPVKCPQCPTQYKLYSVQLSRQSRHVT